MSVLFRDGPAADRTLALRRVPIFLRVVIDADGRVDALDQLDDVPRPTEAIHVYQAVPGTTWALRGDIIVCVRGPGGMQQAATGTGVYEHRADVDGEQLRDTEAWRAWCLAQPDAVDCPACAGQGWTVETETACCGDVLPSGECCAAMYGAARLVEEQRQTQCPTCEGGGKVAMARSA